MYGDLFGVVMRSGRGPIGFNVLDLRELQAGLWHPAYWLMAAGFNV